MPGWSLLLLPAELEVPPMVVEVPDADPPPQFHLRPDPAPRFAGEARPPDPPWTVYALRSVLPRALTAVYVVDEAATLREATGPTRALPQPLAPRPPHYLPDELPSGDAEVLDLVSGRERRRRERAVLDEEDQRVQAAIDEATPDLAALEAERLRPTPPAPKERP